MYVHALTEIRILNFTPPDVASASITQLRHVPGAIEHQERVFIMSRYRSFTTLLASQLGAMDKPTAITVYEKELFQLGHGMPLWFPEPTANQGQVEIGDVGFRYRGEFHRLFNVMHSANDPINKIYGVPEDFEPFKPDRAIFSDRRERYPTDRCKAAR